MAATMTLSWTCFIILVTANVVQGIGVNWGTFVSHPLPYKTTVKMLKDNGVQKVKMFESLPDMVSALAGTELQVMLGVPNNFLDDFGKIEAARTYVKENVSMHIKPKGGVDIRFIAVGNEAFLKDYEDKFVNLLLPAMENVQKALNEAGLGSKIKVTTALNADFVQSIPPRWVASDANIRIDIKDNVIPLLKFLQENQSPVIVNIYPFFTVYQNEGFPLDNCFFDNKALTPDKDKVYSNVFDSTFDAVVWALNRNGFKNLNISVGEAGWPTDGDALANVSLAERFYDGLLDHVHRNVGTPVRPGPMDVYLFALFDEDAKELGPGKFERHWGIFTYDGKGKFPINLNGKGPGNFPVPAQGAKYLKQQWCVMKDDLTNMTVVANAVNYTCDRVDCTSAEPGGSCGFLDNKTKASYEFNQFFQRQDQAPEACDFNGLAHIVNTNASNGTCLFPIQTDLKAMLKDSGSGSPDLSGSQGSGKNAGQRLSFSYAARVTVGIIFALFAN